MKYFDKTDIYKRCLYLQMNIGVKNNVPVTIKESSLTIYKI